jgi:hypothetical protein
VTKLVARLLATAALWVHPDISQKYKMGDISKGVANTIETKEKPEVRSVRNRL